MDNCKLQVTAKGSDLMVCRPGFELCIAKNILRGFFASPYRVPSNNNDKIHPSKT